MTVILVTEMGEANNIQISLVIMKNFYNLIGLEQWYFSLKIPTCENYKPFAGSSIK